LNARAPPRLSKFIQLVEKNHTYETKRLNCTKQKYATSEIPLLLERQILKFHMQRILVVYWLPFSGVQKKKVVKAGVKESLDL
jgi:dephospho-CoA kinase